VTPEPGAPDDPQHALASVGRLALAHMLSVPHTPAVWELLHRRRELPRCAAWRACQCPHSKSQAHTRSTANTSARCCSKLPSPTRCAPRQTEMVYRSRPASHRWLRSNGAERRDGVQRDTGGQRAPDSSRPAEAGRRGPLVHQHRQLPATPARRAGARHGARRATKTRCMAAASPCASAARC